MSSLEPPPSKSSGARTVQSHNVNSSQLYMILISGSSVLRYDFIGHSNLQSDTLQPRFESSLVIQIFHKCDSRRGTLDVSSVFARDGIPGFIFLEGSLKGAMDAIEGLVTVFNSRLQLLPLVERSKVLGGGNPLSRNIEDGHWVRCKYGLYRDDVGFVCGSRGEYDSNIIVALVPRISTKAEMQRGHAGKRKRYWRPLPRRWTAIEVEMERGAGSVEETSTTTFTFRGETYDSGLVMKHFSPASLINVDSPAGDFKSFLAALSIRERPSFKPWVHRFVQESLQPQQRVRVESGDLQGLVGWIIAITAGIASIMPESEDTGSIDIQLQRLGPHYIQGDEVKCRWLDSFGIVQTVDQEQHVITYVESSPIQEVIYIDFVSESY